MTAAPIVGSVSAELPLSASTGHSLGCAIASRYHCWMTQKVLCKQCQVQILPATAANNDGLCLPCKRGTRRQFEAAKQDRARITERARENRRRYDALLRKFSEFSDLQIIAKLESVPALADEGDPAWSKEAYWLDTAEVYMALSDVSAERRLQASIPLLLERACYGDPGEIMRGLRHRLEAIVAPDWARLADICLELASSPRKATRLWAIDQLAILEDPRAKSLFERAIKTEPPWIAEAAARGIERLARTSSVDGGN
jgi:hypothetical protein